MIFISLTFFIHTHTLRQVYVSIMTSAIMYNMFFHGFTFCKYFKGPDATPGLALSLWATGSCQTCILTWSLWKLCKFEFVIYILRFWYANGNVMVNLRSTYSPFRRSMSTISLKPKIFISQILANLNSLDPKSFINRILSTTTIIFIFFFAKRDLLRFENICHKYSNNVCVLFKYFLSIFVFVGDNSTHVSATDN